MWLHYLLSNGLFIRECENLKLRMYLHCAVFLRGQKLMISEEFRNVAFKWNVTRFVELGFPVLSLNACDRRQH